MPGHRHHRHQRQNDDHRPDRRAAQRRGPPRRGVRQHRSAFQRGRGAQRATRRRRGGDQFLPTRIHRQLSSQGRGLDQLQRKPSGPLPGRGRLPRGETPHLRPPDGGRFRGGQRAFGVAGPARAAVHFFRRARRGGRLHPRWFGHSPRRQKARRYGGNAFARTPQCGKPHGRPRCRDVPRRRSRQDGCRGARLHAAAAPL